jgi:hypothetical protein
MADAVQAARFALVTVAVAAVVVTMLVVVLI